MLPDNNYISTKIPFAHVRDCSYAMGMTQAKLIVNNWEVLSEV